MIKLKGNNELVLNKDIENSTINSRIFSNFWGPVQYHMKSPQKVEPQTDPQNSKYLRALSITLTA